MAKQNPKQSEIASLLTLALLATGFFGWQWYQKQPKPLTAPLAPCYDEHGWTHPGDLIISFEESVARVEALNAPVKSGV